MDAVDDGDNISGHKKVGATSKAEVVKQEGTTHNIVLSSYYEFGGSRKNIYDYSDLGIPMNK